jgi:hypothetical protein
LLLRVRLTGEHLLGVFVYQIEADVDVPLLEDGGGELLLQLQPVLVLLDPEHAGQKRVRLRLLILTVTIMGRIGGIKGVVGGKSLLHEVGELLVGGNEVLFVVL